MGITLLEVSLDDAEITANAPFSGRDPSGSTTESATSDDPEDADDAIEFDADSTSPDSNVPIVPLLAVVALFVLAALAKRALSSDDTIEQA